MSRRSFRHFVKAIDIPGAPVDDDADCERFKFFTVKEPAAHHGLLFDKLQRLADAGPDECRNMIIIMPPGSAKSTYASVVFPAWLMARDAGHQLILGSYASSLAKKMGRRTRALLGSSKFLKLFPDCALRSDQKAADEFAAINGSEYMAGGITGGVTGNRADTIIIDDPVKGREAAESETIREKTKDGYEDDYRTRMKPNGRKLIVLTRWHEDDLAGSILPAGWQGENGEILCRDGEVWDVLRIPAESEGKQDVLGRPEGGLLWPEWFPQSHWTPFKRNQRTWASLFQGLPTPAEGSLFKKEDFRYYESAPKHLNIYAGSDYAVSTDTGDYTVHIIVGVDPHDNIYILDLWRAQQPADIWVEALMDLAAMHRPLLWGEEAGVILKAVEPAITKRMSERKVYFSRQPLPSVNNKEARAQSISARYGFGKVYHPASADWLTDFETELLSFPYAKHDDQVDALSVIGRLINDIVAAQGERTKDKPKSDDYGIDDEEEDRDWTTI